MARQGQKSQKPCIPASKTHGVSGVLGISQSNVIRQNHPGVSNCASRYQNMSKLLIHPSIIEKAIYTNYQNMAKLLTHSTRLYNINQFPFHTTNSFISKTDVIISICKIGLVSLFNGIPNFKGYLMPKPSL